MRRIHNHLNDFQEDCAIENNSTKAEQETYPNGSFQLFKANEWVRSFIFMTLLRFPYFPSK
jgi:hypothetical protein